ncbi:MAG: pilus assembly FimT family protein [Candidatus Dependentiae bacterium]
MKSAQNGFTLIEILVVLGLIALASTLFVTNIGRFSSSYARKTFISQLQALSTYAWQQAMITRQLHKIEFDFTKKKVTLTKMAASSTKEQPRFEKIKNSYVRSTISIPSNIVIKNFLIDGFDQMGAFVGRKTEAVHFFIVPGGLTQEVIINFIDTKDILPSKKARTVSLVLNPFNAQFAEYDTFQK